jgi:uncharacterized protein (TIGR03437 family)
LPVNSFRAVKHAAGGKPTFQQIDCQLRSEDRSLRHAFCIPVLPQEDFTMKTKCLCYALFLLVAFDSLAQSNRGRWQTLTAMPSARQEISSAVLNGKIYSIAGFTSAGASTNTVEVYDPTTNQWSNAAPLPIATNHNAAAVVAGRLYAFGGTSNRVFVYDPQQNVWSEVAAMQFQHGNTPAVAVINDRIYVAGGTGAGQNQTELEMYDPASNRWTTLASMSVPRNHCAGGAINGKFYVVGGRGTAESTTALEVYDPATNQWTRLASMPTGRSGIGAAVVHGELYVFGGEIPRMFSEVEVYNPLANSWLQLPPMPTPRHGIFAAVIENKIYLPGGATVQGLGATTHNDVYEINRATTVSGASFTSAPLTAKQIVSAFGTVLATMTEAAQTQPLPTTLGGTTVRVRDQLGTERLAPLFYVSPLQINYQIPAGTVNGLATVLVTSADNTISTAALTINNVALSLFTLNQMGTGAAAALDGVNFTPEPFAAKLPNGEPNVISFFGTGFGAEVTDADGNVSASVQATVGGQTALVEYAGRAPGFTGLNQSNVRLPAAITSGTHTIIISRNGVASNAVTIAIR